MWEKLAPLLPEPEASPKGGPKPVPNRPVVEGILWVLRNGGGFPTEVRKLSQDSSAKFGPTGRPPRGRKADK
jgi:hypothetical protein